MVRRFFLLKCIMQNLLDRLRASNNEELHRTANAIDSNSHVLDVWGVIWDKALCGLSGCAFPTTDKKLIVKVTGDSSEYELFGLCKNIPWGFVKIKHMQPLGDAYLLIKERVTPLSLLAENDAAWDSIVASYVDFMHVYYQELNDAAQKRISLSRAINNLKRHLKKHGPAEATNIFKALRTLAYRGHTLRDLDPDNIGVDKDNQLGIFDAQLAI